MTAKEIQSKEMRRLQRAIVKAIELLGADESDEAAKVLRRCFWGCSSATETSLKGGSGVFRGKPGMNANSFLTSALATLESAASHADGLIDKGLGELTGFESMALLRELARLRKKCAHCPDPAVVSITLGDPINYSLCRRCADLEDSHEHAAS